MATRKLELLLNSAEDLSKDELLELAQQLIARARTHSEIASAEWQGLAGTLRLDEDPMATQRRLRGEWE